MIYFIIISGSISIIDTIVISSSMITTPLHATATTANAISSSIIIIYIIVTSAVPVGSMYFSDVHLGNQPGVSLSHKDLGRSPSKSGPIGNNTLPRLDGLVK